MKFAFRPGLSIAVFIAFAILCALGLWQLQRLEWKRGVIAAMAERMASAPISFDEALAREAAGENMEYQPVFLNGVYAHEFEARVFGTYGGAAGVYVFTPLDTGDPRSPARRFVYVNRGFAPQDFRDAETRADGAVEGALHIVGLFRRAERKRSLEAFFAPADQPEDNLFFIRDPEVLAAGRAIAAPEYYVDSSGAENPARWPKGAITRIDIPNRHFEYALTWFGLAAALVGVFLVYSRRREDA
ncbi:MAG: SURF1 family protein [Parvularculaceae bacterium]|nr:SURF1 family protein [Parvularculaceae bacterium]